jgi:pimeloyl-ACP methyl ester carboxylesterase
MERARQLVPDARFVTLEGAGHVPMADCPDEIATLICGVVAEVEAARTDVA